jgi:hypothetical protein
MLGHQLHGGEGFIEENDLYFFTLRAKDRSLAYANRSVSVANAVVARPGRAIAAPVAARTRQDPVAYCLA